jgi:hypothetical protein
MGRDSRAQHHPETDGPGLQLRNQGHRWTGGVGINRTASIVPWGGRLTLTVLALLLAACGGNSKPAAAPSSSSAAPSATSAAAAGITCGDIDGDLNTVVSDLKTEDAKLQEAWVSGGDSADLQALISDTNGASGSDTLDTDAATFNGDASAYLSDNSPFLAPGWQTGFDQVTSDINALAQDCGQPTAPPNTPSSP